MTRDEMIEKLARVIYPTKGGDPYPASQAEDEDNKWAAQWSAYRDQAETIAAAVLGLVGPKPLVWEPELVSATGLYNWKCETPSGRELKVFRSWWGMQNVWGYVFGGEYYYTLEAAQAAAQAHADAAHWANTRMGDP